MKEKFQKILFYIFLIYFILKSFYNYIISFHTTNFDTLFKYQKYYLTSVLFFSYNFHKVYKLQKQNIISLTIKTL